MERLQKVIANSGHCSRRQAEQLMRDGKVEVNGEIVTTLGVKVGKKDIIVVEGQPITHVEPLYFVLYKPEGCVSTTDDEKGRKTVLDYVPTNERVYPVGRLDYDTSGVLLLTNDGEFNHKMTHPTSGIEKEYVAHVEGFVRKETSRKLERGVKLDGVKTRRARIQRVTYHKETASTTLNIIITEGKNRQVRRMFETVRHPVMKLRRVRFGCVTVEGMAKGDVRRLKPHELKTLLHLSRPRA